MDEQPTCDATTDSFGVKARCGLDEGHRGDHWDASRRVRWKRERRTVAFDGGTVERD